MGLVALNVIGIDPDDEVRSKNFYFYFTLYIIDIKIEMYILDQLSVFETKRSRSDRIGGHKTTRLHFAA